MIFTVTALTSNSWIAEGFPKARPAQSRTMSGNRILRYATAVVAGACLAVGAAPPPPAHAVTFDQVVAAMKAAYDVYDKFLSGALTLDQATTQVINAINAAKTEIKHEVDAMTTVDIRSCARAAVIDYEDIDVMNPDVLQDFARDTTDCATDAEDAIRHASSKAVIDEVGFALNTVGPIALLARANAGFSTSGLVLVLVDGNNGLLDRLAPSCFASPLWGDAEPGGPVEVILRCTAYNGNVGIDSVIANIRRGDPLPPFDYSHARTQAMRGTSWQIATAVLPELT